MNTNQLTSHLRKSYSFRVSVGETVRLEGEAFVCVGLDGVQAVLERDGERVVVSLERLVQESQ